MSSKVAKVLQLVMEQFPGEKFVVFTSFAQVVKHLQTALTAVGVSSRTFTGKMSTEYRREAETSFQDPSSGVRVFIATRLSGAQGLQLTASRIVVFMEPWWARYMEMQARARIRRLGQNLQTLVILLRSRIPQEVLTLLARALGRPGKDVASALTMDDYIYDVQDQKQELARQMLGLDLSDLTTEVKLHSLEKKKAAEVVQREMKDHRMLCTPLCLGVMYTLGLNPLVAAMISSGVRLVRY